jgi:hypothetical protein
LTAAAREARPVVDLGPLRIDGGAHILVKAALARVGVGEAVVVRGDDPDLAGGLRAWCRREGHRWAPAEGAAEPRAGVGLIERGTASHARLVGAERAGDADPAADGGVHQRPPPDWGLAARGALVEAGGPQPRFALADREVLWTDRAARLYAQGAAAQWDPATAVDWSTTIGHGDDVEAAVVQVMTFLVENEEAALVVPARFLGQIHPHFREIQQVLALTVADESRHIEVFTRRATLTGHRLAVSTAGGRASLQTLLDEPDFAVASFLLSVMGEGTFVSLLSFLERTAPDPVTRRVAALARADEARHVAFSLAHLERHAALDPHLRGRLASAVERRHSALLTTAGLNDEVFDALVLLAAGALEPRAIERGWASVQVLLAEMDDHRRARLARLGFTEGEATELSALHTRNFM